MPKFFKVALSVVLTILAGYTLSAAAYAQEIWLEAESGSLTAPMVITPDSTASGGNYILVPNGAAAGGQAAYQFTITEADDYVIWGRTIAPTSTDNSFNISVDGAANNLWDVARSSSWIWDRVNNRSIADPAIFSLSAGSHTLYVRRRDDGTMIDKILITNDMSYVPQGEGESPPNQPPTADASANPTSGFAPLAVQFTGSGTDPDGTIAGYSWNFGDGGTSSQQNPTHTYNTAGTYTASLTVTDDDSATGSDSAVITVNQPANQSPTAGASANPTSGDAPLTVQFTGNGTDPDGTITGYNWIFGDGGTSSEQNPTHIYKTAGTYTATVTVTDDDGATGSASTTITVEEPTVEIPHLIRFQAKLGDAEVSPLNGAFTITFRLYDTVTEGTPLWQEVQEVDVTDGLLDVKLGSQTALNLPFDRPYWLGVEVESDGEMVPRFEMTAVPYSFKSAQ